MWNYKNQKESSRSCFAGCSGIFQVFVCKGSHQVSHMPGPANLRDQRMDGSGVCVDGRNRQRSSSKSANSYREKHSDEGEAELIEQFEPGVYVTIVQLRNETKVFKQVRFSRRRFANQQVEE